MSARCPFAGGGNKTEALTSCPGFAPDEVPIAVTVPGYERVVSCRHLQAVADRWGLMPGCGHPGGFPLSAEEAAELIRSVRRQELRTSTGP